MGTNLDDIVFDPLYGLKPNGLKPPSRLQRLRRVLFYPIRLIVDRLPGTREMITSRKAAAEVLRGKISGSTYVCEKDEDCTGIYDSAKTLFEGSEEWDNHVKPWLEMSKTIRSFVWPLTALFLYDLLRYFWRFRLLDRLLRVPVLRWFGHWEIALAALLMALVLYVWLRAFHMRAMYQLVKSSEYIRMEQDKQGERRAVIQVRHLAIGEAPDAKKNKHPEFLLIGRDLRARAIESFGTAG
jgi:hypothetical protein